MAVTTWAILVFSYVVVSLSEDSFHSCPIGFQPYQLVYNTVKDDDLFTFKIIDVKNPKTDRRDPLRVLIGSGDFIPLVGKEKFSFHLKKREYYFQTLCVTLLGAVNLTIDLSSPGDMGDRIAQIGKTIRPKKARTSASELCIDTQEEYGIKTSKAEVRFRATLGTGDIPIAAKEVIFQDMVVYTCVLES